MYVYRFIDVRVLQIKQKSVLNDIIVDIFIIQRQCLVTNEKAKSPEDFFWLWRANLGSTKLNRFGKNTQQKHRIKSQFAVVC